MNPGGFEQGCVAGNIGFILKAYTRKYRNGRVVVGPTGFYTRGDDTTVRAADVAFIGYEWMPRDVTPPGYARIAPELVVRIVSPEDDASRIQAEVREWLDFGVLLVWVVYPEARQAGVCDRSGQVRILDDSATIDGGGVLPGFHAKVSGFFDLD